MSWASEPREGKKKGSEADADPGRPVLLVSLLNPVEAEIVVSKLRSAGIESYLKHEALSVVYGLTVDGAGQQDIMVRADELDLAKAALEAE